MWCGFPRGVGGGFAFDYDADVVCDCFSGGGEGWCDGGDAGFAFVEGLIIIMMMVVVVVALGSVLTRYVLGEKKERKEEKNPHYATDVGKRLFSSNESKAKWRDAFGWSGKGKVPCFKSCPTRSDQTKQTHTQTIRHESTKVYQATPHNPHHTIHTNIPRSLQKKEKITSLQPAPQEAAAPKPAQD